MAMDSVFPGGYGPPARPAELHTSLALSGDTSDIAVARHEAARFLTEAAAGHAVQVSARALDLAQLVVSELVTNALKYADGPVLLALRIVDGLLEIEVWDSDPVLPVARAADVGRVGQHGLEIVMAVVHSFEAQRKPVGKRITVRLVLGDTPEDTSADRRFTE